VAPRLGWAHGRAFVVQGESSALADTLHGSHIDELVRVSWCVLCTHAALSIGGVTHVISTVNGRHRVATTIAAPRGGRLCSRTVVCGEYTVAFACTARTVSKVIDYRENYVSVTKNRVALLVSRGARGVWDGLYL